LLKFNVLLMLILKVKVTPFRRSWKFSFLIDFYFYPTPFFVTALGEIDLIRGLLADFYQFRLLLFNCLHFLANCRHLARWRRCDVVDRLVELRFGHVYYFWFGYILEGFLVHLDLIFDLFLGLVKDIWLGLNFVQAL
jgi:hypothetical protein